MKYQVFYRIDGHAYDPVRSQCSPACRACRAELVIYDDPDVAVAEQPIDERALRAGDQAALDRPPRRFQVVPVQFV